MRYLFTFLKVVQPRLSEILEKNSALRTASLMTSLLRRVTLWSLLGLREREKGIFLQKTCDDLGC